MNQFQNSRDPAHAKDMSTRRAAQLARVSGYWAGRRNAVFYRGPQPVRSGKYMPHQGKQEVARRFAKIAT